MQDFIRSKALNNIPYKKLSESLLSINNSNDDIKTKSLKLTIINRYYESNIPVEYWPLKMETDFHGDHRLLTKYNEYTSDIKKSYSEGSSICFAGLHGVGKSMTSTSILKKSVQHGYNSLYTTFSDIVSILTTANFDDKYDARKELMMVDFLVIDEVDPRFISSDNAADLYARTLESIFRTRSQNKLPTIMCTNSPNVIEVFNGPLKTSLESLMKGYMKMFPVFGQDFRIKGSK